MIPREAKAPVETKRQSRRTREAIVRPSEQPEYTNNMVRETGWSPIYYRR